MDRSVRLLVLVEAILSERTHGVGGCSRLDEVLAGHPGHTILVALDSAFLLRCAMLHEDRGGGDEVRRGATHGTGFGVA